MDFIKEITCIQAVGTSDDEARKCPCCKKSFTNNNPAVGGHVLAERGTLDIEGKLIYVKYITPICKQCNDRYKNNQVWKLFKVHGYNLCRLPNNPPKR